MASLKEVKGRIASVNNTRKNYFGYEDGSLCQVA